MNPFFSVIIPLYNKENYIQKTLESVLKQEFSDFEVIIVNDGSTDNSAEMVKQIDDPRISYYEQRNKGVSAARNQGISLAKGQFIAFLDADDYWYPHYLKEINSFIGRFPEQKVFATAIEFEYRGRVSEAVYSTNVIPDGHIVNYFEASLKQSVLFTSASVFDKGIFRQIGLFDESIKRGEDIDLWIRVGMNYPVVFIGKVCVCYSYDPGSLSRNGKNIQESASFSKYAKFESGNEALKKFLDLNRFSLAIKSRLCGDKESFTYFKDNIDRVNLSSKKRLLLLLPAPALRISIYVKYILLKFGIGKSVFVK